MQHHFLNFNAAKQQFGQIRSEVSAAIRENNAAAKELLWATIDRIISGLKSSLPFFASIGQKCAVEVYIVCYQSLHGRLNSARKLLESVIPHPE